MVEGENVPASGTPWDALLSKTMAGKRSGTTGVILVQHSMPTPRQFAMESSICSDGQSGSGAIAKEMIGHVPRLGYGAPGYFVTDQAFVDLCHRCDGSVIFVSCFGHKRYSRGPTSDHCSASISRTADRAEQAMDMFWRNGATVDLASNPFGWEEDAQDENDVGSVLCSRIDKLQSVANAIRHAAITLRGRNEDRSIEESQPVVFDSLTPLLSHHGVEKVALLLESLGLPTDDHAVLSPIIAPVLYESIRPSDNRRLEDLADAMVQLHLLRPSTRADHKDTNEVMTGTLEMIRRRGGKNGLGGKLVHEHLPISICHRRCRWNGHKNIFYWILNCHKDKDKDKEVEAVVEIEETIDDEHVGVLGVRADDAKTPSRPRIFLEDNDPEYADFDEEDDLDDDLDL